MSAKRARRRLFVDWEVQGALITRFFLYWCICLFTIFVTLIFSDYLYKSFELVGDDSGFWLRYGPALLLSATLTIPMLLDLLQATNRFAGPMVRTRRFLRAVAKGEKVDPIAFRTNDFWRGYADDLNSILQQSQNTSKHEAAVPAEKHVGNAWKGGRVEEKEAKLAQTS